MNLYERCNYVVKKQHLIIKIKSMFHPSIKSKPDEDICILLKLDNHPWNYICDCGDASKLTVKDCQNTAAIFISHTHIDHFCNFDTILRHQLGIQRRVIICGPIGIAKQVQAKILSYTWNLIEANSIIYEIREIIDEQTIQIYEIQPPKWELKLIKENTSTLFENKQFGVQFTILDHKIPSIAYLFKEKDSIKIELAGSGLKGGRWVSVLKLAFETNNLNQKIITEEKEYIAKDLFPLLHKKIGHSVGVILDHAATKANHLKIRKLFIDCDLAFIECNYKTAESDLAEKNHHSYATKSGEIMRLTRVKEAIPVHFSRRYESGEIEEIIEEFNNAYLT